MTTRQPNYDLLKDAYAVIDGIPYQNIELEDFYTLNFKKGPSCNTIACAGGWLSFRPEFQKLGLAPSKDKPYPEFKGDFALLALTKFFRITLDETYNLFSSRCIGNFKYDYFQTNSMNDKQLFLHRVRCFLAEKGQL